eukprot:7066293-Pyramimonas_sp.AAC.1
MRASRASSARRSSGGAPTPGTAFNWPPGAEHEIGLTWQRRRGLSPPPCSSSYTVRPARRR